MNCQKALLLTRVICVLTRYIADLAKCKCHHLIKFTMAAFLDILDDPNCLHVHPAGKKKNSSAIGFNAN